MGDRETQTTTRGNKRETRERKKKQGGTGRTGDELRGYRTKRRTKKEEEPLSRHRRPRPPAPADQVSLSPSRPALQNNSFDTVL